MAQEKKFFHGKCRNRFQADDFCVEQKSSAFFVLGEDKDVHFT